MSRINQIVIEEVDDAIQIRVENDLLSMQTMQFLNAEGKVLKECDLTDEIVTIEKSDIEGWTTWSVKNTPQKPSKLFFTKVKG